MIDMGRYIVVEGLEGAGKSSAINTICSVLNKHNIDYIHCREPGGTAIAESLRQIIKGQHDNEPLSDETELLLMYAARKQLLDTLIRPTLESGKWVVSDRNEWSSITYQGYGRGLDLNFIRELSKFTVGSLRPDRIIYLDIDPELGLKRAGQRGDYDRIEQESSTFFNRVHDGYKSLIANSPQVRVVPADMSFEQVQDAIEQQVIELIQNNGCKHG